MSVAESIPFSRLELTSGAVAMAVAQNGGVPKESGKEAISRVGSPRNVVFASKAPKLNESPASFQERGLKTYLSLTSLLDTIETEDLSTLDQSVFASAVKKQMAEAEKLLGGNVPVIQMLMDEIDAAAPQEAPVTAPPPPAPEPQESFKGTSIADVRKNVAAMVQKMSQAQLDVADSMLVNSEMAETASDQSLASIEVNNEKTIENLNEQGKVQEKQGFWHRMATGLKYAATIVAGAIMSAVTMNPTFLVMAVVLVAMQVIMNQTGLQDMISNLGPAARVFAELAVVVVVAAFSALASGGVGLAMEAAATTGEIAGESLVDAGLESGGEAIGKAVAENSSKAASYAVTGAVMGGGSAIISSGLISDIALGVTELVFLGNEDKKKAKKIFQAVFELVLTIALSVAMMAGGVKMGSSPSASTGMLAGKLGTALLGTGAVFQTIGSATGTYASSIGLDIAELQKEYGYLQANTQQATSLSDAAMDTLESNRKSYTDLLNSMFESFNSVLRQLVLPWKAAADAMR